MWPKIPALARWCAGPQRPRPLGASERSDAGGTGPNGLTQATLLTQTRHHLASAYKFSRSNTAITVTFSESVQASSITSSTFVLKDHGSKTVTATVSHNDATHMATLQPSSPLASSTTYTATISGATDAAGNTMTGPFSWSFATTTPPAAKPTVTSVSPVSNAAAVPISTRVTATFATRSRTSSSPVVGPTAPSGLPGRARGRPARRSLLVLAGDPSLTGWAAFRPASDEAKRRNPREELRRDRRRELQLPFRVSDVQ